MASTQSTIFLHPNPAIARQIRTLLPISVVVSTIAVVFSLCALGFASAFVTPVAFLFTIAHHLALVILSTKYRVSVAQGHAPYLPPTARKTNIVYIWVLTALWTLASIAVLTITIALRINDGDTARNLTIPYVELAFDIVETGVMTVLALRCTKERRLFIGHRIPEIVL